MPKLDELANAEWYLTELYEKKRELPNSTRTSDYVLLPKSVALARFAHDELRKMLATDREAIEHVFLFGRDEDLIRPNGKRVRPLKEAIKVGLADPLLDELMHSTNQENYDRSCGSITPYQLELALRSLEGYNSLYELTRGECVQAGSRENFRQQER